MEFGFLGFKKAETSHILRTLTLKRYPSLLGATDNKESKDHSIIKIRFRESDSVVQTQTIRRKKSITHNSHNKDNTHVYIDLQKMGITTISSTRKRYKG